MPKQVSTQRDYSGCLKIRCYVQKGKTRDGNEFNYYRILESKTHKKVDCRFTRTVNNTPFEDCILVVHPDNINKDTNRDYPCYWIREIVDMLPLTMSKQDVRKYFTTDDDNDNGGDDE